MITMILTPHSLELKKPDFEWHDYFSAVASGDRDGIAKWEAHFSEEFTKWLGKTNAYIARLEEAALALALKRLEKKGHHRRDSWRGFNADFDVKRCAYEIEAARLFPELIDVLFDLQSLCNFSLHFEKNKKRFAFDFASIYSLYDDPDEADEYFLDTLDKLDKEE